MESAGKRTRLKRNPLADCTNTLSSLKRTEKLPLKPSKVPPSAESQESSIGSNAALNTDDALISTGSPSKSVETSVYDVCKKGSENVAFVTQRTRQQRMKAKGKAIIDSVPSSCPPFGRSKNFSGRVDKLKKNSKDGLSMENPKKVLSLLPCTLILTGSPSKSVEISVDDVCKKGSENVAVVTQRTRQQRMKDKGKAIIDSVPSSCPPIGRSKNFSGRVDKLKKNSEDGLSMENPKKRRSVLPQDFIDKQLKIFEEVDKFELMEEEVSPSEMDD